MSNRENCIITDPLIAVGVAMNRVSVEKDLHPNSTEHENAIRKLSDLLAQRPDTVEAVFNLNNK